MEVHTELRRDDNRVLVYGAGGHAKVVLATIEAQNEHQVVCLLDDDGSKHGTWVYGYPVIGGREQLPALRSQGVSHAIVAIGDNSSRAELAALLVQNGFCLATAVHPAATVLRGSQIGEGTVVLPNAFVGADARLGEQVIVSVGAVVGHDTVVGSFAQLCPGVNLAGGVKVGEHAFIGMGAAVLPGVKVGRSVVVGANAVVTRDLPDGTTAAGAPARILKGRTVEL